jgi:hypothetical protein
VVALASGFAVATACGDPKDPPKAETTASAPLPVDATAASTPGATPDTAGVPAGESSAGVPVAQPPADLGGSDDPARGPCRIRWADGRSLRFTWTQDGGSLALDGDGDGRRDTCATFKSEGDRISYLRVDEGCDRSTEATLRMDAPGARATNLATGKLTRGSETSSVSLVWLPAFAGVLPGYLLPGRKKELRIDESEGLVRRVTSRAGGGRPARRISFTYDGSGRISAILEDEGADGSAELQQQYLWNDDGRLDQIVAKRPDGTTLGHVDYECTP